jgi:hypothetical protein
MPDIVGRVSNAQVIIQVALLPVESFEDVINPFHIEQPARLHVLNALVDTGAQSTCITKSAATRLGLTPIGAIPIQGVSGRSLHNNYLFKMGFSLTQTDEVGVVTSNLHFLNQPIEGVEFHSGSSDFDVLLGMNVLSVGDLTITRDGRFKFSF